MPVLDQQRKSRRLFRLPDDDFSLAFGSLQLTFFAWQLEQSPSWLPCEIASIAHARKVPAETLKTL